VPPASGIFVAMLAIGGGWGRLIGMAVQSLASGVAGAPTVSLPAYTIVGAAAMLGEEQRS
jgi:H+/Cl- antiporter ClcA